MTYLLAILLVLALVYGGAVTLLLWLAHRARDVEDLHDLDQLNYNGGFPPALMREVEARLNGQEKAGNIKVTFDAEARSAAGTNETATRAAA